jgi:hypothetical protein
MPYSVSVLPGLLTLPNGNILILKSNGDKVYDFFRPFIPGKVPKILATRNKYYSLSHESKWCSGARTLSK